MIQHLMHPKELFQEFEEVIEDEGTPSDGTTPSVESGNSLGIGLAVVARYVRNMKGQIRVHSEPGKGTIFGIELPFEHAKEIADDTQPKGSFPLYFPRAMSDSSSARSTIVSQMQQVVLQETPQNKPTPASEIVAPSPESSAMPTPQSQSSPVYTDISDPQSSRYPFPRMIDVLPEGSQRQVLSVLVAEDNPINSKILNRRLLKLGHQVHLAQDGQECHDHFTSGPQEVDVILMDIQVSLSTSEDTLCANLNLDATHQWNCVHANDSKIRERTRGADEAEAQNPHHRSIRLPFGGEQI